ncbi:hypothetical protein [Actinomadura macra]|uniref:hypothetical protein n=1 Tax=Actinomadura macra TaxID=46164 RepID=UPI0012FCF530|nr:hypothetical protein [Actinomadura macra]
MNDSAVTTFQSPTSPGAFAYIEYILTNPTGREVLLDFPGDVFVKRDLVTPRARGRCMPQASVPEDMCTPPTRSEVVRRLAGGEPIAGDGGDTFMPPGASYLVRATVDVPVERRLTREDMGLYVWSSSTWPTGWQSMRLSRVDAGEAGVPARRDGTAVAGRTATAVAVHSASGSSARMP